MRPPLILILATLAVIARAANPIGSTTDSDLVLMRQIEVEGSHSDWKYLSVPGGEILSRASNAHTQQWADGVQLSLLLQQKLLPAGYLAPPVVPITCILYDQKLAQDGDARVVPKPVTVEKMATDQSFWGLFSDEGHEGADNIMTGLVSVSDPDTLGIVANLWQAQSQPENPGLLLIYGSLLPYRISHVAPMIPLWLFTGIVSPQFGLWRAKWTPKKIIVPGARWISQAESEAYIAAVKARAGPKAGSALADLIVMDPVMVETTGPGFALLPMKELFRERRPSDANPARLWHAEAALFVRWGYFKHDDGSDYRKAFNTFVERSRREPVTEGLFRDCFGFGYTEMELRLARYLPIAAQELIFLPNHPGSGKSSDASALLQIRPARPTDIARIIGDWERMKAAQIKAQRPETSREYLARAGEILRQAYQDGSRDPRLLAVLGLYENDVGDKVQARAFLENATAAGVVRPEADVILGGLRYLEAKAHPAGPGGKFSLRQTISALQPLFLARQQAPLSAVGYGLIAEVWAHSSFKPTPEHLAALTEGVALHPRLSGLALIAANVDAAWGDNADAATLADMGLRFADGGIAEKLRQLKEKLAMANPSSSSESGESASAGHN